MSNKILIRIIFLSIISIIIGLFGLADNSKTNIFINAGGGLFFLTGVFLLIKNGEFIKTKEFRSSGLGVPLIIIGVMFKIMHWKYADIILAIGCLSCIITYLIYMIRKYSKLNWTNWLKLIFISTFFAGRYFKIMHWKWSDELTILSIFILLILVINFIKNSEFVITENK